MYPDLARPGKVKIGAAPLLRRHRRAMIGTSGAARPDWTNADPRMTSSQRAWPLAIAATLALPGLAEAGMPSFGLTEIGRLRLETISFFLMGFLVSAWLLRAIWNGLRPDFPGLPRLSYRRALMLVGIWGLAFLLVLTMISGARELMTPGAWKKQGLTYKLADDAPPSPEEEADSLHRRTMALDRLRAALWRYAEGHGGQFPPDRSAGEIPDDAWRVPDPSGLHYVYVPGRKLDDGSAPLAFEPGVFGPDRMVLEADGSVRSMTLDAIRRALPGEVPR